MARPGGVVHSCYLRASVIHAYPVAQSELQFARMPRDVLLNRHQAIPQGTCVIAAMNSRRFMSPPKAQDRHGNG